MNTRLHDTATRIIEVVYLVIVLVAFAVVIIAANAWGAPVDGFVRMVEARFGVVPGVTKVWPDCGCSIHYFDTQRIGRDYYIHIKKLD